MDELGIDELALVFQAVERSAAGAKALGACEQVCEGWRDVLRSREGALAWHRVAGGPQLQAVWQHPDAAGAAPRFADRPEALADEIASLKKAVAGTETLALLGGLAHALEGDPDGDVNVTADDDGAWQFLLDPVAAASDDRAIRSLRPFPPLEKFAELADEGDREAAAEADGIAGYWEASRRHPRRVHTKVWQPRLTDGALSFVPLECLYYEVAIEKRPAVALEPDECIAIGFGTARFPLSGSQPGWKPASVGYHSDDGNFFSATGHGREYGPRYGDGDTVGCGLCLLTRSVFFTHNGKYLGVAKYDWIGDRALFPIIGVGSHTRGTIRFGASADKPAGGFLFDPATWPAHREADFKRTPPPPPPTNRQRLPEGLEALETLDPEHPVVVALLQMLQQMGIYTEDEADGAQGAGINGPGMANHPMRAARAAYLRELVGRLGHVEDGEFIVHEDESDDDGEGDEQEEQEEEDDEAEEELGGVDENGHDNGAGSELVAGDDDDL